ncbi:MAG: N-acetylglucosamine-6-phosphate deacetylase [Rhodobacteraceae bacterium]|nr:N-acetylglucosamine-6-phosphate deacetylase [Paracoccaceae bacterium]
MTEAFTAGQVFDGRALRTGVAVAVDGPEIAALLDLAEARAQGVAVRDLGAGILAPGLVDLQVNGGDGVMLGAGADARMLERICAAHARLGATLILPTLITDRPEVTVQVIEAGMAATRAGIAGFGGLHLEGPHLDPGRAGAHDPALIRPMSDSDLALLERATACLPALMVTVAPEAVSRAQIARLVAAGVVVSLGHSGCSAEAAHAASAAGATCATHLFNAMGPLAARAPGLVGAVLTGPLRAGIIADGVHVAEDALRVALAMKAPDALFLVSDAMAVAGTAADAFDLGGRRVLRRDGRLTLEDGTLAGADISLPQSLAHLARLGVDPALALAMASRIPAEVIGAPASGRLTPGARADLVHLAPDWTLRGVWQGGARIARLSA